MDKDRIARYTVAPASRGKGVGVIAPALSEQADRIVSLDVKGTLSKPDGEESDHG